MYIDKIIKREFYALLVCVIVLVIFIICMLYFFFFKIDNNISNDIINKSDINISICNNINCNEKYTNNKEIGTSIIDGTVIPNNIYSYYKDSDAILNKPYIFNISNIGNKELTINISLTSNMNESYNELLNAYILYKNYIKIAISNCNDKINRDNIDIYDYSKLDNNIIIKNVSLDSNEDKTYCIWTWIDKNKLNNTSNLYFIASLDTNIIME